MMSPDPCFALYSLGRDLDDGLQVFRDLVRYGVDLSGLTKARPEDFRFYVDMFEQEEASGGHVTHMMIRGAGKLLDKAQLTALGMRGNAKISYDYFETLNERGIGDLLWASLTITKIVNIALNSRRDMIRDIEVFSAEASMRFLPSPAADGPCDAAQALANKQLTLIESPILPLLACTHPDQCGCRNELIYSFG